MPFLLLMPSFNQAHYIVDAIRSILAQDDPDWELWIVDNSTDTTPQIMQQFNDLRIRFHHFPDRMDPGTCLNWMLDRAVGREFSYVHTDNNLRPNYVRRMREALSDKPLGLAYCDMRTIDENGRCLQVFRRGKFNLPRLLSTDPLGVPFSATTELARQVGGFGVRELIDDVRFCTSAYGLASYAYIPEPLLDYRNHTVSRTEVAGGNSAIKRLFIDLMPTLRPALEERGVRPLPALSRAICSGLDEIDFFMEDLWYRKAYKESHPWKHSPNANDFFWAGLLYMPGLPKSFRPRQQLYIRNESGGVQVSLPTLLMLRLHLKAYRGELRRLAEMPRGILPTWACMELGVNTTQNMSIRIRSLDVRTLWAAHQLWKTLQWTPLIDSSVTPPKWLPWATASGAEPLLDCSGEAKLTMVADDA